MARQPNVFDPVAMADSLRRQDLAATMVSATISDVRLMLPRGLRQRGPERCYALCEEARTEWQLNPGAFWPDVARHRVEWAENEIATYKAQKQPKENQ